MPSLVFRLRNVPEDEADDVRKILDDNHISWYETTAGNWGIAMPGIWVSDDDDVTKARMVIEQYQHERSTTMKKRYDQERADGDAQTIATKIKEHPLRTLGTILFCLFIVYVMINPFLQLIEYSRQ